MQLNSRLGRLEQWTDQNVVKWSEVQECWRIMTTLFDQTLAQQVSDEVRGEIWGEVIRVMLQEARENGSLP